MNGRGRLGPVKALCVAVSLALALSACGSTGSNTGSGGDKSLTLYEIGIYASLDPAHPTNDDSFSVGGLLALYDRIIHLTPDGDLQPGLAEEWKFTDTNLQEFEFTLRKDAQFQDGTPVDSKAIVANLERLKGLGEKTSKTVKATADLVKVVEAIDDQRVRISLSAPDGGFAYRLAGQAGMMVSPEAINADGTAEAVGAGPFSLEKFVPNEQVLLKPYMKYWDGKGSERPSELDIKTSSDAQARLNAVMSGEADVALIEPSQVKAAKSANLKVQSLPLLSFWLFYTNLSDEMKDVRVRHAISYAIDRQAIADNLTGGTGAATEQLYPEGSPLFIDELKGRFDRDPRRARALLAEAGFPNGVDLTLMVVNFPEQQQMSQALQTQLAEAGIRVTFVVVDISQFQRFVDGETDMYTARWGGRADPLITMELLASEDGTYTPGDTASPALDKLILQAKGLEAGSEERTKVLREAHKELIEQMAVIPIVTRVNLYAYRDGCILGLHKYVGFGADDWRDVRRGDGCAN